MEEKKIYYYTALTMRDLIQSINAHNISKNDIIQIFPDKSEYIVVYEL